ncbi:mRNA capping enzyme, beta chain protein [Toxoplasma gondii TgCatPRC2]|uniref:mRNA-capping enzyme triphosphatase n=3 Tax=Toxoplasma gondii TaxID=5811 RepID=CET_TOXGM|nr:mRNA capping enzyme, beta chain protein [Toxoplasma gondii ME49]EPT26963.1 mRNA capping enzyme, beta chain protein [Toxoplasma gondii ME49]KYF42129.1 mRNA capping enzyme, beta chain protein [Toxoplasma gondii ARI]KYK71797.1 mRNA capping enzyme, beta chain protein [Toxoplasma gondii TgCatPRC2]|eukprot:XP_018635950.1 mRNA capping enzyme, beta chain protein [Toxoplasma gondii ME49]
MESAGSPAARSTGSRRPAFQAPCPSGVPPPQIFLPAGSICARNDPNGDGASSSPHQSSSGTSSVAASSSVSSSSPSSSSCHSSLSSSNSPSASSHSSPQSSLSPTSPNATFTLAPSASLPSGSSPFAKMVQPDSAPNTNASPLSPLHSPGPRHLDSHMRTSVETGAHPLPTKASSTSLAAVSAFSSGPQSTQGDADSFGVDPDNAETFGVSGTQPKSEHVPQARASTGEGRAKSVADSSACSASEDAGNDRGSCAARRNKRAPENPPASAPAAKSFISENGSRLSSGGELLGQGPGSGSGSPDIDADLTIASERLDGGRTRLCDSLAAELAQQLEMVVEDTPGLLATVSQNGKHSRDSLPLELEIEGRLGVLVDLDTGSRLRLPLSSLTLLSSSFCAGAAGPGGGPPASAGLRFEAGVNQNQFASLHEFITATVVGQPTSGPIPSGGVHTPGGPGVPGHLVDGQKRGCDQRLPSPLGGAVPFVSGATEAEEEGDLFSDWESLIDESSDNEDEYNETKPSRALKTRRRKGRRGQPEWCPHSVAAEPHETASWKPLPVETTEEEYHNLSCLTDTAIRVSYPHPKPTTGNLLPTAAVWKSNQMTWNLYAGQDSEQEWADDARAAGTDDGVAWGEGEHRRCRVDCRLAINLEHHASLRDVARDLERKAKIGSRHMGQTQQGPIMRRIKKRQSFVHPCGVRIDLTEVCIDMGGGGRGSGGKGRQRVSYEVETELNATLVLQAIQYKQATGDNLPLLSLCVSFLTVLEDLSVHLNAVLMASSSTSGILPHSAASGFSGAAVLADGLDSSEPRFADLSRCFPPSPSVALFKRYLSPCLPLVGDYGFRAVAPALARKGEEELEDYLSKINVDEQSLYTNDTVTIVGPWVPCLNEEGRLEFAVPVARPNVSVDDHSDKMASLVVSGSFA